MRILVDTNVVLDILLNRPLFVQDSQKAMEKALSRGDRLFLSSSAVTDIYYVIRKQTGDRGIALEAIKRMSQFLVFADVGQEIILSSTDSELLDFEDAVVDGVASSLRADLILTRNIADFAKAKNRVMDPASFLSTY